MTALELLKVTKNLQADVQISSVKYQNMLIFFRKADMITEKGSKSAVQCADIRDSRSTEA